jgi:hypothetical protein
MKPADSSIDKYARPMDKATGGADKHKQLWYGQDASALVPPK